jgi:hypothetical protein
LSDDNGQLVLHPFGLLNLELRGRRRGNRARLKLTWTEEKAKAKADSLRVRSDGTTRVARYPVIDWIGALDPLAEAGGESPRALLDLR